MLGFNFEGFQELHVIVKITYKISFRNWKTISKLENLSYMKYFIHYEVNIFSLKLSSLNLKVNEL